MDIRLYKASDCIEVVDLFHGAVHGIPNTFYSEGQLEAWSPTPPDYQFWQVRLAAKQPFVAVDHNTIIGFIELEDNGHIDCLYVHNHYQGQGVAGQLLRHVMQVAQEKDIDELYVEASKVAVSLFEKHGFELKNSNVVTLGAQLLTNYQMTQSVKK